MVETALPAMSVPCGRPETAETQEWLVGNGLGGYASGTVSNTVTRRYHGFLVASLPAPHGRVVMFNHLDASVVLPDGTTVRLAGEEEGEAGSLRLSDLKYLREFRLEGGLPVWRYEVDGVVLERSIVMPFRQNTVFVTYRLLSFEPMVRLLLRPLVHFRYHEAPVDEKIFGDYRLSIAGQRYEIQGPLALPPLRFYLYGDNRGYTLESRSILNVQYGIEYSRGYQWTGDLWSPGIFHADLSPGNDVSLVASTESWETMLVLDPRQAVAAERERERRLLASAGVASSDEFGAALVIAADRFVISPRTRSREEARAAAFGDEVRTVIAGYHWFADWGRDTMISLEGLTLVAGRYDEAGYILRTFSQYIRSGLIPNMFPEGENEGLYNTADATLWYFQAISRYLQYTNDRLTLRRLLPVLEDIVESHLSGTRFGIKVDPQDSLLMQGEEGYQLTWMDAKVENWVVTPRRGKAVEINALWYNAVRLLQLWHEEEGDSRRSAELKQLADSIARSFNERFWYAGGGYLYDVVDGEGGGNDAACRPNQIFAISLEHPVLNRERWESVFRVVTDKLLTPFGLRSLSADHSDYKKQYYGDLRARDAAYHQGTVWAWLIGPYVDSWLKVSAGDVSSAAQLFEGFKEHMLEACVGSISEIFDAEEPFTPRGCIAQAWSVAEVLRAWTKVR